MSEWDDNLPERVAAILPTFWTITGGRAAQPQEILSDPRFSPAHYRDAVVALIRSELDFVREPPDPKACPHGFADWDECPDCCH